jgi:uncharacterized membrane protein
MNDSPPVVHGTQERALERAVSRMLAGGVLASGALIVAGFLLYAMQPARWSAPEPMLRGAWALPALVRDPLDPFLYLYTGLVLLMLTPVARVLVTAAGFARARDWRFTIISLAVFIVIVLSIVLSITG